MLKPFALHGVKKGQEMNDSEAWILKFSDCESICDLDEIRNFSIIWNYFESTSFDKNFKTKNIQAFCSKTARYSFSDQETTCIRDVYALFSSRYEFEKGNYDELRHDIGLKGKDLTHFKDLVATYNKDKKDKIEEAIKILIYIAFRFRNNFFHGEKEIKNIKSFEPIFKGLNSLLIILNEKYVT
ncbi:hypothetical protein PJI16_02445 [Nitrospira sp. MA-1]|nr:hypothetical protein [Nitrospira sp. MA-1]